MEHVISGNTYLIAKLNAFDQLKIARKLAATTVLVGSLVRTEESKADSTMLALLMLSYLSDDDAELVTRLCLGAVSRRQDAVIAKIWSSGGLMFADIGMQEMLQLTAKTIVENLGDFFLSALANMETTAAQV